MSNKVIKLDEKFPNIFIYYITENTQPRQLPSIDSVRKSTTFIDCENTICLTLRYNSVLFVRFYSSFILNIH